MIFFPNAKINLGLHILSKRIDGYHEIDTVFYPVGWCDTLEVIKSTNIKNDDPFNFTMRGARFSGDNKNNLCYKAFALLQSEYSLPPMECFLQKRIPAGAGLGGGSADAAATLLLINEVAGLNLSEEQLSNYATTLGSDCAFFLEKKPVRAAGTGSTFFPVQCSLASCYIVIVMPAVTMNTTYAYSIIKPSIPEIPLESLIMLPVKQWKYVLKNDFEELVFQKHSVIKLIKDSLYSNGAIYASMSGSGTAVYGIFEKQKDFSGIFKDCKVWTGKAQY